jgi:hypothetical protein
VEVIHAKGDVGRGMVVWPNCQIDKLKNQNRPKEDWFAGIAAVHPMSRLHSAVRDNVVALNRAQFFPLPANGEAGLEEPSYADLRYIWPVRYSLLDKRMASLSVPAIQALQFQLFWFFTEIRVQESVTCPHCSGAVDASTLFQHKDVESGDD